MQFTAKTGVWVTALLLVGLASFCIYKIRDSFKIGQGVEYPAADFQPWFEKILGDTFGWAAQPPSVVEKVWVDGFQDHTWLLRVRIAPETFDDIRRVALASKIERIEFDDRSKSLLSVFDIGTTRPSDCGDVRIPDWWKGSSLGELDRLSWLHKDKAGGGWFGYDRREVVLYVLVYGH